MTHAILALVLFLPVPSFAGHLAEKLCGARGQNQAELTALVEAFTALEAPAPPIASIEYACRIIPGWSCEHYTRSATAVFEARTGTSPAGRLEITPTLEFSVPSYFFPNAPVMTRHPTYRVVGDQAYAAGSMEGLVRGSVDRLILLVTQPYDGPATPTQDDRGAVTLPSPERPDQLIEIERAYSCAPRGA